MKNGIRIALTAAIFIGVLAGCGNVAGEATVNTGETSVEAEQGVSTLGRDIILNSEDVPYSGGYRKVELTGEKLYSEEWLSEHENDLLKDPMAEPLMEGWPYITITKDTDTDYPEKLSLREWAYNYALRNADNVDDALEIYNTITLKDFAEMDHPELISQKYTSTFRVVADPKLDDPATGFAEAYAAKPE